MSFKVANACGHQSFFPMLLGKMYHVFPPATILNSNIVRKRGLKLGSSVLLPFSECRSATVLVQVCLDITDGLWFPIVD
jgi:hypothetical protein